MLQTCPGFLITNLAIMVKALNQPKLRLCTCKSGLQLRLYNVVLTLSLRFTFLFYSRLGVSELVLVDNDAVSASNVNRQVLFSVSDVGRSKVEAARETLESHNIRTGGVCG